MGTIGIEWIRQYHGRLGLANLTNSHLNARGFYNTLVGIKKFEYSDDSAWDQDFEESGAGTPSTGTDISYADNVDICYFVGHGNPNGPFFGVASHDDGQAKNTEVRLGNGQLEWIVFDACQVLQDNGDVFNRWKSAFRGLHYILGFHSSSSNVASRGTVFAQRLNQGWTVRDAWIDACVSTEGSATYYAYLRAYSAGADTYNDHWHGKGSVSSDPNPSNQKLAYLKGPC